MNYNKTLYVMVGIPASGKSYKSKSLKGEGVEYVSRDEVRFSIIREGEEYFSQERKVFREFIGRVQSSLDVGKSVIADATHINEVSRYKLLRNLKLEGVKVVAVYCDTDFETCLDRNGERDGRAKVPLKAMFSMKNSLTEPKKEEGFDFIIRMSEEENI